MLSASSGRYGGSDQFRSSVARRNRRAGMPRASSTRSAICVSRYPSGTVSRTVGTGSGGVVSTSKASSGVMFVVSSNEPARN